MHITELYHTQSNNGTYHIGALPEEKFDDRCVTRSCSQVDGPVPQLTHGILHANNVWHVSRAKSKKQETYKTKATVVAETVSHA